MLPFFCGLPAPDMSLPSARVTPETNATYPCFSRCFRLWFYDSGNNAAVDQFGAVPVSPRNMYRLLKRGDNVLLFPGGVSEAYHKK